MNKPIKFYILLVLSVILGVFSSILHIKVDYCLSVCMKKVIWYICTYTNTIIFIPIFHSYNAHTCTSLTPHTSLHTTIHICTQPDIRKHADTHLMYAYVHMIILTHTHMHTHIWVCAHIHTHTHTHLFLTI